ncbi:MAG: hypothetical protein RL456_338 [Pseudomonadota bacterium]|jgi:diguanylate cyclase (GGDEF)-like protein
MWASRPGTEHGIAAPASRRWPGAAQALRRLRAAVGPALFSSRLARRIFVLFLIAASVPIAVLGLMSLRALDSLSRQVEQRERSQMVRAVAMMVFDRMVDARSLLGAWPDQPLLRAEPDAEPSPAQLRAALPGFGSKFRHAARIDRDGHLVWSTPGAAELLAEIGPALPEPAGHGEARSSLLARERNGQVQLVLAEAPRANGMRWVVELAPGFLWQPVVDASADASWCVQDAQGLRLHCPTPSDVRIVVAGASAPAAAGSGTPAAAERVHTSWNLFLRGEFGATDWRFDMVGHRGGVLAGGLPLTRLTVGATLCALLVVAMLSLSLIRRTLVPLQRLRAGTRQVEQRESGARVDVAGNDEFSDLARAFNQMAERIDEQFRSLELLASIDRDIVGHREVDEVFRRVLVQGLRGLGVSVMGLARIESDRVPRLHLQWNDEAFPGKVRRSVRPLAPAELQALLDVTEDRDWPPADMASSATWCAPMRRERKGTLQAYPLRWQDRTHGLLLVGWAAEPSASRLREVVELRDRLSVALASFQRERELTWQARHDDLTGLLNRNGLHHDLDELLRHAEVSHDRADAALAVLFIDLDHFKTVNDNLGHGQGDELLRQAADRLEACAPTRSIVARPGGDEFVVVLPGADLEKAVEVASAICRRMALPFPLSGHEYFLGASIGIALAPVHGHTRTTLLRHADMAMYTAKDAGRGRHALFEAPLDELLAERSSLLADLRQAVARDELVLYFQPRVVARTGEIASAEALIRWRHPTRGLLSPGLFIPLAEESDLIESIGLWVIRAACAQLARWRREGVPLKRLSVNVSPRQLQSGLLVEEVEAALVQHGVPWHLLELEVTESLLVGDARAASEQLGRLRERGLLIALDDFGTGYSSMATLRNLPVDVMKVDRAFVSDLTTDPSALAITRAILTLAGSLGKHTVAEGIETPEQAETLRALGCDELQGFLFSKPVPAEEFAALCVFNAQVPLSHEPTAPAPLRAALRPVVAEAV